MTVGPDLGWLADDEGNLRPEVARDLFGAAVPPPPGPPAPAPIQPPVAGAAQARRPLAPPLAPVVRVRVAPLPIVPLLLGVIGTLVGFSFGIWFVGRPMVRHDERSLVPETTAAGRAAFVNGLDVNVRTGPGLSFPPILKLTAGEDLLVGAERDGWFAVTTNTGMSGWVFGAFLRGEGSADRGAAIVTQLLTSDGVGQRVVLRPGDKVFVVRNGDGQADVVLPTGRRLRVAPEALIRVD